MVEGLRRFARIALRGLLVVVGKALRREAEREVRVLGGTMCE